MSILKVGSSNPKLSWILQKNPATIAESKKPFTRQIRKGCAYGFFTKQDQEFILWFRDSDLESSFANGVNAEFEYLDTTRYGSPYLPISLITNCLSTAAKKIDENDTEGFEAYVTTAIKVSNPRFHDLVTQHYAGIAKIESTLIYGDYYEVTIKAPKIYTVLNVIQIVCLLQSLCDDDTYVELKEAGIEKYINCLNAADAPYFVRYLFSTRAFSNRASFAKLKDKLQGPDMILQYGNTRQQRFDAISDVLTGGETLIDIGCGEMFYGMKLCGKYETIFAVDADAEQQDINQGKLAKRSIDNIVPLTAKATPEWVKENEALFDGADVLLTEVIEHMSLEEANALIEAILSTNYKRLIVTTPNKDFNVNYGFSDTDMRHDDHQFELPYVKFAKWMEKLWETKKPAATMIYGIGDSVADERVTAMAVFEREHPAVEPKLKLVPPTLQQAA